MAAQQFSPYPVASTVEEFRHNLATVRARIDAAAEQSGRGVSEVRLLPVGKTVPQERLRLAVAAGCTQLGENKVQEAKRKRAEMADLDIAWSVIGHLQTNKAKDVATFAAEFHALDSVRVAHALDRRLQAEGRALDVFVQVNTSGEESKYGLAPEELPGVLREIRHCSSLRVRGLMTLAVFSADEDRVRRCFRLLRRLRDEARDRDEALIGDGGLSMGMSGDYEIAVEEGATCVRVGQAIFGARSTPDSQWWPGEPGLG